MPVAMFMIMSGGVVSVPSAMLMPMSRQERNERSAPPPRTETSGQWMIDTPWSR